jgi:5-methylcytosine-specific restriction endonuclease McrA
MAKAAGYVPHEGPIVTRAEAKAAGLPRYFTGKPCPHGHVVERLTANGTCRLCSNRMAAVAHRANRAKHNVHSRAWYARNKDKVAAQARAAKQKDPERVLERSRRWVRKNRQYTWDYYAANSETIKARIRQWVSENRDKTGAYSRNRRARVAQAEGSHTGAEIQNLLKKQKGRCAYCSANISKRFHADHIVPLVDGGSNWISNIQLTCPRCNTRKNRTDPAIFAARMGRLL